MQVSLDTNLEYDIRIAQYNTNSNVRNLLSGIEKQETNSRNESQSVNKMEYINVLVYLNPNAI